MRTSGNAQRKLLYIDHPCRTRTRTGSYSADVVIPTAGWDSNLPTMALYSVKKLRCWCAQVVWGKMFGAFVIMWL